MDRRQKKCPCFQCRCCVNGQNTLIAVGQHEKKGKRKELETGQVQDTRHAATGHKTSSLHD